MCATWVLSAFPWTSLITYVVSGLIIYTYVTHLRRINYNYRAFHIFIKRTVFFFDESLWKVLRWLWCDNESAEFNIYDMISNHSCYSCRIRKIPDISLCCWDLVVGAAENCDLAHCIQAFVRTISGNDSVYVLDYQISDEVLRLQLKYEYMFTAAIFCQGLVNEHIGLWAHSFEIVSDTCLY